jgi:hypothetical protein
MKTYLLSLLLLYSLPALAVEAPYITPPTIQSEGTVCAYGENSAGCKEGVKITSSDIDRAISSVPSYPIHIKPTHKVRYIPREER